MKQKIAPYSLQTRRFTIVFFVIAMVLLVVTVYVVKQSTDPSAMAMGPNKLGKLCERFNSTKGKCNPKVHSFCEKQCDQYAQGWKSDCFDVCVAVSGEDKQCGGQCASLSKGKKVNERAVEQCPTVCEDYLDMSTVGPSGATGTSGGTDQSNTMQDRARQLFEQYNNR